jgi:hypothetical protein
MDEYNQNQNSQDQGTDEADYDDTTYDNPYTDDTLQPLLQTDDDYVHGLPLLSWNGPSDLPEEENRRWFLLIIVLSVVLVLLAILMKKYFLTVIILLVSWLTYMLSRIPAQEIEHTITSTGIFTNNKFYAWNELSSFYIIKDHGHYVLGLDTNRRFFSSVPILLGNQNPVEVKEVLLQYLPNNELKEQDVVNTWIDKASNIIDSAFLAIKERFFAKRTHENPQQPSTPTAASDPVEFKSPTGVQEQLIVDDEPISVVVEAKEPSVKVDDELLPTPPSPEEKQNEKETNKKSKKGPKKTSKQ